MSLYYSSLTVPDSKKLLNQSIRRFVINQGKSFQTIETKDCTIYQLEFQSEFQKNSFELEFNERFPFILN